MHILVQTDGAQDQQAEQGQATEQEAVAARSCGLVVADDVPDAADDPGGTEEMRPHFEAV